MSTLRIEDFTIFRDGNPVVNQISFSLPEGTIVGLIGPNGAGKSTTIGGILGLVPITSGAIHFDKWDVRCGEEIPPAMKRRLAFIPEQPMFYSDLTLMEHFDWKLRLWGMTGDEFIRSRLDTLINRFQLTPHLNKFPHQCSKGTLQKLMIVAAFLFPFDVLIIDEPFIGLDVLAIRELRTLVESARNDGAGVLLSTHVLDSAEKMCDSFVFMMDGTVFAAGTLADLRQMHDSLGGPASAGSPEGINGTASLEDMFISLFEMRRRSLEE